MLIVKFFLSSLALLILFFGACCVAVGQTQQSINVESGAPAVAAPAVQQARATVRHSAPAPFNEHVAIIGQAVTAVTAATAVCPIGGCREVALAPAVAALAPYEVNDVEQRHNEMYRTPGRLLPTWRSNSRQRIFKRLGLR